MSPAPPAGSAPQAGFLRRGLREWSRKLQRARVRRKISANHRRQRDQEAQLGAIAWAEGLLPAGAEELRQRLLALEESQSGVASRQASIDEERARLEEERRAATAGLDARREALKQERKQARQRLQAAAENDKPQAQAAVAAADVALAELARERKASLGPLDQRLAEVRKAAAGENKKGAALGREKHELLGDLGRATVNAGMSDPPLNVHLDEIAAIETARAQMEATLADLLRASAAMPRGVMLKFNGLVAALVAVPLLVVGMLWWSQPGAPTSAGSRQPTERQRARSGTAGTSADTSSDTSISAARLEELVASLGSDDPDARVEAGRELGAAGAGAVGALLAPLRDGDETTRADAAYALAEMRTLSPEAAADAIPALIAALQDESWRVRANAALALGKAGAGYDEVWEPLAATVGDDDPRVRGTAAYALGRSGVRPAASVDILAARLLEDEIPDVRVLAANALGLCGERSAAAPLATALSDDNWEVQYASIRALGLLEDAAVDALPALIDRLPVLPPWRAAMVATSIRMIVEAAGPEYRPAPALVSGLELRIGTLARALSVGSSSDDVPISRALPTLLRWTPGATTRLTVELTPQLWGTGEGSRRPMAQDLLPTLLLMADVERPRVAELTGKLDDRDRNVRWAAVAALGATGDERAVVPLTRSLGDDDRAVRKVAALSLAHIDPAARAPLSAALREGDAEVRLHAAYAIASMGRSPDGNDQATVAALTSALHDDSFVVREAVACALKIIQRIAACDPEALTGISGS